MGKGIQKEKVQGIRTTPGKCDVARGRGAWGEIGDKSGKGTWDQTVGFRRPRGKRSGDHQLSS